MKDQFGLKNTADEVTTEVQEEEVEEEPPQVTKLFRIIASGEGEQDPITSQSILVNAPVSVKGALFDITGNYLEDAQAVWTLSSTAFPSANITSADSITATFTPTTIGAVQIVASYAGSDPAVQGRIDYSALISVSNIQSPDSIIITAGNNQSGTVNNNLASEIQVRVLDEFGQGIDGESVTFSVTQGSGAIIGTNPVVTSGGGYASVIAKLGTAAGGNNNQFRATIGALTADFTATATPGPQHHLTWTTQPAILFQNSAFGVQPVIELRDEFENPIDASGTVTITVDTGTGAVAGTNPVNLENGVATFTDLEYSAAEGGVILQASNGAVSGNSSALTVGAAPPGACKINNATFITADGGCKDISTGLIWSSLGPYINDWYRVVWDSLKTGALIPDVDDYGRGSDYSEDPTDTPCGSYCDDDSNAQSDVISYCKSLNEGGRTDWRMPTKAELQYVGANGANNHLAGNKTLYYWSSSSVGNGYAYAVRLSDGDLSTRRKYDGYPGGAYQVCVRGERLSASALEVVSGPSFMGPGFTPPASSPLIVKVVDSNGDKVNAGGTDVTISATTNGSLGGTLTVAADSKGFATFDAFTLDTSGATTITISSPGLTQTTFDLTVQAGVGDHACRVQDADFQSIDGGCKHMQTGLVWSSLGPYINDWYRVVWDSLKTGAISIDADDYERGNDYSEDPTDIQCGSYCDNDSNAQSDVISYCKSLDEGGYTDWRMPTKAELQFVGANGAYEYFTGDVNFYYWSSSSVGNGYAYAVRLSDGDLSTRRKYDGYPGGANQVCVRGGTRVASSKLVIANGSISLAGAGITGGIIKVQIQDASGNNVNAGGKTLTLNSTDLGTLGGVLTAQTDAYGLATFDAFTLDTAGNATITFTAPGFTSVDHVMEVRAGLTGDQHICSAESSRFRTQNGGCHDTINNLVWSKITTGTLTWNQVAWDSALAGNDAPDGDDGARTNDRDPSSAGAAIDTSLVDYCHDLEEGGFTDWRMPTSFECLDAAVNSGPYHHFEHNYREKHFWNGYTTSSGGGTYAYRFGFLDSGSGYYQGNTVKANLYYGVCVRDP